MSSIVTPTMDIQMGKLYTRSQKHNLRMRSIREPRPALKCSVKRKTLQVMVRPLKRWLCRNKKHPYPNKLEKIQLCSETEMTVIQVSNWFANARRRLKSTVSSAVTNDWASRINQYNDYIVGKQEMLSDTDADEAAANPTDENLESISEELITIEGIENFDELQPNHLENRLQEATSDPVNPYVREFMMCRYLDDQHASVLSAINANVCNRRQRHTSGSTGEFSCSISDSEDSKDEFYWKEITAAMALTDMSRMKSNL